MDEESRESLNMPLKPFYIITVDENKRATAYKVMPVLREKKSVVRKGKAARIKTTCKITALSYIAIDCDEALKHRTKGTAVVLWLDDIKGSATLKDFEDDGRDGGEIQCLK